jgi:hypothetical protein
MERKPRLPLGVGDGLAALQRLAQRRESRREAGVAIQHRVDRGRLRRRAGHVADEMNHRVTGGDADIEFVEDAEAEILEVLLDLHFDIVAREVMAKLVAVGAEFIGNAGDENADGHGRPHGNRRKRGGNRAPLLIYHG